MQILALMGLVLLFQQDAAPATPVTATGQETAQKMAQQTAPHDESKLVGLAESEAVADFVSRVVKEWAEADRTTGTPFAEDGSDAWLAETREAQVATGEAPSTWAPFGEGWLTARSFGSQGTRRLEGEAALRAAVIAAFDDLGAALGGRASRPLELHVKRVWPDPDLEGEFEVDLRLRALRAPNVAEGWVRTRWSIDDEERELQEFRLEVHRVSSASGDAAAPGFEDVAGSLLQGEAAGHLARSIADLRGRLDASFGVGVLGHHGVAVGDLNGDGLEDLYLCQPGGVPNQLWLRRADGTALEGAQVAGLDVLDASSSALLVDLDNDGDKDVVLASGASIDVFAFAESRFLRVATFPREGVTSLTAADVDLDGRLDVYACAYAGPYTGGALPLPYHDAENGAPNLLLMNRTESPDALGFADETVARGLAVGATRFSFAAAFEDIDGDGDADLYVANDFGRNALYLNDGAGRFDESAEEGGVVDIGAGMGACFADLDQDGDADLYVSNMESSAGRRITGSRAFDPARSPALASVFKRHAKGNSLFLGRGDGTFDATGLAEAGRWAWGSIPVDLDGNGALDLYVPNGFVTGTDGERPDL